MVVIECEELAPALPDASTARAGVSTLVMRRVAPVSTLDAGHRLAMIGHGNRLPQCTHARTQRHGRPPSPCSPLSWSRRLTFRPALLATGAADDPKVCRAAASARVAVRNFAAGPSSPVCDTHAALQNPRRCAPRWPQHPLPQPPSPYHDPPHTNPPWTSPPPTSGGPFSNLPTTSPSGSRSLLTLPPIPRSGHALPRRRSRVVIHPPPTHHRQSVMRHGR